LRDVAIASGGSSYVSVIMKSGGFPSVGPSLSLAISIFPGLASLGESFHIFWVIFDPTPASIFIEGF
jgi:hypothetical protein